MRVVVFGATGAIGRHAVRHALAAGHEVTAFVRSAARVEPAEGLIVAEGQIDDYDAVRAALEGADAVIWCVGIPLKRKYERMASLEGHEVLLRAMHDAGVRRLVDWGTPSVPFERDRKSLTTEFPKVAAGLFLTQAKAEMVAIGELLEASDLDWTLVRFLQPTDGEPRGSVKVGFGDTKMSMKVTRSDIALFMVEQLESDEYVRSMPIIGS